MNIEGKLLKIRQAELLLLDGEEVGSIGFQIQTETETIDAYALASEGTAFHTLENNPRFRNGVGVKLTGEKTEIGFKVLTIRFDDAADASGAAIADIQALKDRAMKNMNMTQGELHALLAAFESDTPQHYAIAVQLRQQHRDETVAISEKVCRCQKCRATFELDSPRYTYGWGKSRCPQCEENVAFDLVDPLPRESTKSEVPDWQEMQKRLQDRFGGAKKKGNS